MTSLVYIIRTGSAVYKFQKSLYVTVDRQLKSRITGDRCFIYYIIRYEYTKYIIHSYLCTLIKL